MSLPINVMNRARILLVFIQKEANETMKGINAPTHSFLYHTLKTLYYKQLVLFYKENIHNNVKKKDSVNI